MGGWLVYHPRRERSVLDGVAVYHDATRRNQDPYVWNARFLHTYCHSTQLSPQPGDLVFWVSGDPDLRRFTRLPCDLVFVVGEKRYWPCANHLDPDDPLVDSAAAYQDHYRWHTDHPYARRRRYTLKADPDRSFQPQDAGGELIDALPLLGALGFGAQELRDGLRAGFQSKPLRLDGDRAQRLYALIAGAASIRYRGDLLQAIRARHPELAS